MRFAVLGPVEIRREGARLELRAGRERSLLALLVLNSGYLLTLDRIVELLWDEPPGSARAQVYNLVSRLRQRLRDGPGAGVLETGDGGYRLVPGGHSSDLADFRQAAGRGRGAVAEGAFDQAAELFSTALGCWRGTALSGCTEPFALAARQALEEERWRTREFSLDTQLALGRPEQVLTEVGPWLAQQPHREDLYRRQMLALVALGRSAEALTVYRRAYRALRDDLGVEPGTALRALQRQILDGTPVAPRRPSGVGAAAGERTPATVWTTPAPTPRQLPPPISTLCGRQELLARVDAALRRGDGPPPVVVLTGPGGVGKTALALHTGHALAEAFPDGQLYADLRGSREVPADPYAAVARFLRGLGVDGQRIPTDPDERVADLRSRLAGRAVLLVLDDARDEAQLRPLLPGTAGCAVLVTSRRRLAAVTDAHRYEVSHLAPADATRLLALLVGPGRTGAEPEATAEVARLCGRLPLALRIAGARLAARPDWTISGFRDRLARHRQRLDQLTVGDLDVRAGIALSYRSLPPEPRLALRRLGLLTARSVPGWVVGALVGDGATGDDRLPDQLVERHLLEPAGADQAGQTRFHLHDLVHDFAYERAVAEDSAAERDAAVWRVLTRWLALASAAAVRLGHGGVLDPVTAAVPAPPEALAVVRRSPDAWFAVERGNLVDAVTLAGQLSHPELASDLALQLNSYLLIRFDEREREEVLRAAIDCWQDRPTADRRLSRLYFALCWAMYQQDRYAELAQTADRALTVARDLGDPEVIADARWQVARATALRGRLVEAARGYQASVRDTRRLGLSDRARVYALTGLANVLAELGDAGGAAHHYRRALRRHPAADRTRVVMLLRLAETLADLDHDGERGRPALDLLLEAEQIVTEIGDQVGAAHVDRVRGLVDIARGDWPRARTRLGTVLATLRAHGEESGTAGVLRALGDVALGCGEAGGARAQLREALALYRGMALPIEVARTDARLTVAFRLSGEFAPADRHARAYRQALDTLGLPAACLRLPCHLRPLLPGAGDGGGGFSARVTRWPPGPAEASDRLVEEAVPGDPGQHVLPGQNGVVGVPLNAEPGLGAGEPGVGVRAPDAVDDQSRAHEVVAHGLDEDGVAG